MCNVYPFHDCAFGFLGSARRAVTKLISWARTAQGVSPGFPKCDRLLPPAQKIVFLYDCNVGNWFMEISN